ncbi:MAG: hypothetical protein HKP42_07640 [Maribacter sp.]|nr:hypothetical protein [Maribacter sp.]NNK18684.1 hypothetical protein [Maribacter sp.]NNK75921.1 hypothetical protein [Maribacter sp.]
MTLQNALNYFKRLESETTRKSEIKVYQKFIQILTGLEHRDWSDTEVESIEEALDAPLGLYTSTTKDNKFFVRALKQFQNYLKDTFSLTTKRYYTNMGVGLGASFGIVFGTVFLSTFERSLGISYGITLGMIIGLIIGHYLDSQAKASGRMI